MTTEMTRLGDALDEVEALLDSARSNVSDAAYQAELAKEALDDVQEAFDKKGGPEELLFLAEALDLIRSDGDKPHWMALMKASDMLTDHLDKLAKQLGIDFAPTRKRLNEGGSVSAKEAILAEVDGALLETGA